MNEIASELRQIALILLLTETSELEEYYEANKRQIATAKNFGSIIDPTGYRDSLQNGDLENAELQSELCKHLINAKKIVDKFHPSVKLQIISGQSSDNIEETESDQS